MLSQIKVQLTVFSYGKTVYFLIYLNAFFPKFLSHSSIF